MRPTLLGSAPTPKFEYVVMADTKRCYFEQCSFVSDVELSEADAIRKAMQVMGARYGSEWKVERL